MNIHKIIIYILFACTTVSASAQKHTTTRYLYTEKKSPHFRSRRTFILQLNKLNSNLATDQYILLKRLDSGYCVVSSKSDSLRQDFKQYIPANSLWRTGDNLAQMLVRSSNKTIAVQVVLKKGAEINFARYGKILSNSGNIYRLEIRGDRLIDLLDVDGVEFADLVRKAKEEISVNDLDLTANRVSTVRGGFPLINGKGVSVSIKEDKFDRNDLDLLDKSVASGNESSIESSHATIMATLLGGLGNSSINGMGVAPETIISSSSFDSLLPDDIRQLSANAITIQNHSYGTDIENYYGIEALAYDEQAYNADTLVHVFSSGNIGTSSPSSGIYSGLTNWANLSGTFKQAKNILVIGGTDRNNVVEDLSSRGPTFDGRLKPDIVAAGEDGTSGASATTSGVIALLQQSYRNKFNKCPSAALLKAILINSARSVNGISFKYGYGVLNAIDAIKTINENHFINDEAAAGQQKQYILAVPENISKVKISLAWNDPPASLNAPQALVNDLDLSVVDPTGRLVLPWTLDSSPINTVLSAPAVRKKDTLNNAEQVTIEKPLAGKYLIMVDGKKMVKGPQPFHIAYQLNAKDSFDWEFPIQNDQMISGTSNYLRWNSTMENANAVLSVSYDDGQHWEWLAEVTLIDGYYNWQIPMVFTQAKLKMTINNVEYISASFSISPLIKLDVGYVCSDGILLQWHPQDKSIGYHIYAIRNNKLELIGVTKDTVFSVSAAAMASPYYAVSAIGNSFEGVKSYTINVYNQGVGCYVRSLLADLVDTGKVDLMLQLGSIQDLKSITWTKMNNLGRYVALGTTSILRNKLTYKLTDDQLKYGIQFYKVILETNTGKLIESNISSVINIAKDKFRIYPNPFNASFNIISDGQENYRIDIFDGAGKRVLTENRFGLNQNIDVAGLPPGMYILVIMQKNKPNFKYKLVKIN